MSKILIDEAVVRQALEALDELTDTEQTYGALDRGDKAITALRQALADAALDKMADNARELGLSYEQPAQEPVYAFRRKGQESFCTCDERRYDELSGKPSLFEVAVFYTTPPAPAQPLTDEQEREAFEAWCYSNGLMRQSYGVLAVNSQCDVAWRAWQARAANGITKGNK
jgi:hypothetical protein